MGGGLAGGCSRLRMGGNDGRGGEATTSPPSIGRVAVADVIRGGKAVFLGHEGPSSGNTGG